MPAPGLAIDLIAKVGDPALGFSPGTLITSFVEPPSINDAGYAALHVTVTGGVHAIYRWHRGQPLHLVAKGTDVVAFATGSKTLTFLETPIVDDLGWVAFTATLGEGGRGMVVWQPTSTLHPVAVTGQTVSIQCEKTTFAPCDVNPVLGPLATMATFNDRKGAIFRRHFDLEEQHELLFRGAVTTAGTPDALHRWAMDDDGGNETFGSIASNFVHFPGGGGTNYFQGFTDLAACGSFRYGLVGVSSTGAPLGVVEFDPLGGNDHVALDRHYTVDTVLRKDFHCLPFHFSYAGARSDVPSDHTQSLRGVFIDGDQVYAIGQEATGTAPGATLGEPYGQAMTREDPPRSVFAAKIVGTVFNGFAGVWVGKTNGEPVKNLLTDLDVLTGPAETFNEIWTVHVGGSGTVVYHGETSVTGQAILRNSIWGLKPQRVLSAGDTIPDGAGGEWTIDQFWTLGGGFNGPPVVTGTGGDGLLSALNDSGQMVLVVYGTPTAGPQRGGTISGIFSVDLGLFVDDFESADYCVWSAVSGGAPCP